MIIIIAVLTVFTIIYCFYWRKDAKVKPHQKIKTLKSTEGQQQHPGERTFIRQ